MADYYLSPVVDGETFEPLVKVGDTLPIGAIIGFDTTQTIPNGWEYYAENQIKKIAPVTPANGNIENTYGTSQENTYAQSYINTALNSKLDSSTIDVDTNYVKIENLIICYGEVSSGSVSANSGKDLSINLPTTYTDTNYKVIASINTGSSYWAELNLTAHADTTSKIEISLWNNGANATDCTISYIVIGK
jgi:hypothetical protein